jgi:hypothetical protein
MDNFLHLSDEEKERNKKTTPANTFVDKERIQRLKRNFLPFWARELAEQNQEHDNKSPEK